MIYKFLLVYETYISTTLKSMSLLTNIVALESINCTSNVSLNTKCIRSNNQPVTFDRQAPATLQYSLTDRLTAVDKDGKAGL